MGFWNNVKDGAGLGLGGSFGARIGWELGGWVVTWLKRLVVLLVIGLAGLYHKVDSGFFSSAKTSKPVAVKKQGAYQTPTEAPRAKAGGAHLGNGDRTG